MPATIANKLLPRVRLPGLVLALVLIVVGPFLLLRAANERSAEANARVDHTRQVEVAMQKLASDVRNVEAAALARVAGVDTPMLKDRTRTSRARVQPSLAEVQRLTRDNPAQQVRIGMLAANVGLRLQAADAVLAAGRGSSPQQVRDLVARYPIQPLVDAVIAEERSLLASRMSKAARKQRQASALGWGAMLAQLALLAVLAWNATRQAGQRLGAESDARRASARAAVVLDTVRDPIVLADAQLRVVMHNAAFNELYGVAGDVRGQPLAEVSGGAWDDEETLRRLRDVLARDRELWDLERTQHTADGRERVMLINARRMALPDSDDDVVLVTAADVTVQKAAEQHIRELNRQLGGKVDQVSDVNRELEAFSYSVSHDLRAPLRHIAGFADKLTRQLGADADEKSAHYLQVISSSAKRMSTLIDDLLVYSRLGRSALRLQAVDMQSMVADTRALLDANSRTDRPDHRIDWDVGALPVLVGDENMLRQVWLNLLGNAVKYSGNAEPARIEVRHEAAGDGVHRFTVRDNGAGFDMAYADKLFGVFQRLHSASEFSGTGIGLANVRRVLLRHGGTIRGESSPGQGALFSFTLPSNLELPSKGPATP